MATYQELKGAKIKNYTEDLDNPYVGQLWYNTTTDSLRIRKETISGDWSSGGNLNTEQSCIIRCLNTNRLAFGGGTDSVGNTEQYDGTSWTEVNDLNTARQFSGRAGATNTAALCIGGSVANNESWNGTNWTELGDLNATKRDPASGGTTTVHSCRGGFHLLRQPQNFGMVRLGLK